MLLSPFSSSSKLLPIAHEPSVYQQRTKESRPQSKLLGILVLKQEALEHVEA